MRTSCLSGGEHRRWKDGNAANCDERPEHRALLLPEVVLTILA
jgi:hypothetical protein